MKSILLFTQLFLILAAVHISGQTTVVINEFLASNVSTNKSTTYGEYADWIELVNLSNTSIDLSGYYLTDDPNEKTKWKFPPNAVMQPNSYLIIWADDKNIYNHTNFKLSRDGEFIGLYSPIGNVVDSITFGYQYDDVSYGRFSDDRNKWGFFKPPTPQTINISSNQIAIAPAPTFSIVAGYYSAGQVLTLTGSSQQSEIRYTIDGTTPTKNSTLYTTPIKIDTSVSIRACSFEIGKTQSPVITNTYLINEQKNLTVVSIVTDPANLFDDKIGIYVTGTNGIRGSCDPTIRNLNQDWERPVNIEIFETSGKRVMNQGAGIKIFGGCSRTRYPQKSFALFARSEYGKGSFEYKLFPEKPIEKYESFILRSSSDDQVYTMFRDALAHLVMKDKMDAETQAYRPAVLFINGQYWGIHNIREKINENYLAENFGVNPDDVNILESNAGVVAGTNAGYTNLINFVSSNNMAVASNYDYVKNWMDVNQFIDYQIGHIYLAERDWPGNNIKYWRSNSEPFNKWRWINFDLDQTFTYIWITEDMMSKTTATTGASWPNPEWSTRLFRNLLKNDSFKNEFIQRYAWHANVTFKPERLIRFIDSISTILAPEIPRHIKKWGDKRDPDMRESWTPKPTFKSYEEWLGNVDTMRIFSQRRPVYSTLHMLRKFGLSGVSDITVSTKTPTKGIIKIVDRNVSSNFTGTFYNDIPLKLSAVPIFGSKFSYWEVEGTTNTSSFLIPAGSVWKYLDTGINLGTAWYGTGFNDSNWPSGTAQLGYGDGDEATTIGFGGNASSRYVTSYFRKSFSVPDISKITSLSLEILADDGAVVYLNGSEIQRVNMPGGTIQFSTLANGNVADENAFLSFTIPSTLLQNGQNFIAVEVHQSSVSSSDLSFDLRLTATTVPKPEIKKFSAPEISIVLNGNAKATAYFEEDFTQQSIPVVINEINYKSASDFDTEDWIEIYNYGNSVVDLSGWQLHDTNESAKFIFPNKTILGKNEYLVLCKDTLMFASKNPSVKKRLGNFSFGLSNDNDKIFLKDAVGSIIDEVNYSSLAPWPSTSNGTGKSIELANFLKDNNNAANWSSSKAKYGTPGASNSVLTNIKINYNNLPSDYSLSQNYPNPFNPETTIQYQVPKYGHVLLRVFNILGEEVAELINDEIQAGIYTVKFDGSKLSSGVYFYQLKAESALLTRKLIIIK